MDGSFVFFLVFLGKLFGRRLIHKEELYAQIV